MEINTQNLNKKVILGSLVVAVILLFAIISGLNSGKATAQAELVFNNAKNVQLGLENFYNDQEHFPSLNEFSESTLMLDYFSSFPLHTITSKNCAENYVYKRQNKDNYTLSYCLATSYNKVPAGWLQIVSSHK